MCCGWGLCQLQLASNSCIHGNTTCIVIPKGAVKMEFALDTSVLPMIQEKKGTLLLRSNHMKYGRATLNSNWHADREAEPKNYDVTKSDIGERDLLRATYNRIGNITDGTLKDVQTTQQEAMWQVHKLKEDFQLRDTHKAMVAYDNFDRATTNRETGKPERGYGSVLPRHTLQHDKRHLSTTHRVDYQYPFDWSPKQEVPEDEGPVVKYRHGMSEFTDTADHRRKGLNTWQDSPGSIRDY